MVHGAFVDHYQRGPSIKSTRTVKTIGVHELRFYVMKERTQPTGKIIVRVGGRECCPSLNGPESKRTKV